MKLKKLHTFIVIILIAGIIAACNDDNEEEEENSKNAIPVETIEAEKGDFTVSKTVYGRLEPASTTPVMLEEPGEIDTLEVSDGDTVEEDDTIAKIKSPAGSVDIEADASGLITELDAKEGDMVSNEDPLAVIAEVDPMKLTFNVTAKVRKLFEKDDEYETTIEDEDYDAAITRIKEMPDDTGLYPVEASVENDGKDILPGMIARMEVPDKRVEDTIIVPTSAVVTEEGETFIFVVRDDEAEKIEVDVTETESDNSAIEGDIDEKDQVITNGQMTLVDGSQIEVVKEENES